MDEDCLILNNNSENEKNNYSDLSGNTVVKESELLTLKGGYIQEYGCESYVCAIDRSGAKELCSDFTSCFQASNRCFANIMKAYGMENFDYPDPRCIFAPNFTNTITHE